MIQLSRLNKQANKQKKQCKLRDKTNFPDSYEINPHQWNKYFPFLLLIWLHNKFVLLDTIKIITSKIGHKNNSINQHLVIKASEASPLPYSHTARKKIKTTINLIFQTIATFPTNSFPINAFPNIKCYQNQFGMRFLKKKRNGTVLNKLQ